MEQETGTTGARKRGGKGALIAAAAVVAILAVGGFVAAKKGVGPIGGQGRTVATVNGKDIKQHEVDIRWNQLKANYQGQNVNFEDASTSAAIKKQIVDEIVNEELVYAEAKKQGVASTDEEKKTARTQVEQTYGGADKLEAKLKEFGMTQGDLNAAIERNIVIQKFIDKTITPTITVTDQEVTQTYQTLTQGNVSSTTPPLSAVKDQISQELKRQKLGAQLTALIDQLKKNAQIKLNI